MNTSTLPLVRTVVGQTASAQRQVKQTTAEGLDIARIVVDVDGFGVPLYTARPAGSHDDDLAVLLLLSESFGMHPYIEDVARRLAHDGYLVVLPDLMARQGDPADYPDPNVLVAELLSRIPDAQVMGDLDAALDWAVGHGGDSARVGIMAFSWGGRWAWLYATRRRLRAGVIWYGVLDDSTVGLLPPKTLAPLNPVDVAADLQTPVLGLYASDDAVIPVSAVENMRARLDERPVDAPDVEFVIYPGAVHGFHADFRDDYDEHAATDSWKKALTWLHEHGLDTNR